MLGVRIGDATHNRANTVSILHRRQSYDTVRWNCHYSLQYQSIAKLQPGGLVLVETAVSVRLSGDTCVSSGAHSFGQVVRKGPVNIRPLLKWSQKGTHEAIFSKFEKWVYKIRTALQQVISLCQERSQWQETPQFQQTVQQKWMHTFK